MMWRRRARWAQSDIDRMSRDEIAAALEAAKRELEVLEAVRDIRVRINQAAAVAHLAEHAPDPSARELFSRMRDDDIRYERERMHERVGDLGRQIASVGGERQRLAFLVRSGLAGTVDMAPADWAALAIASSRNQRRDHYRREALRLRRRRRKEI